MLETTPTRLAAAGSRIAYFILSLSAGYFIAMSVPFRSGNPDNISNVWNAGYGWNPESNYLHIALLMVLTCLFYWAAVTADRRLPRFWVRAAVTLYGSFVLFVPAVLGAATPHGFDTFHYGEQLSPSAALMAGKTPFTEIFVLHGGGEDIFKPALGYLLFSGGTPSIGAYLTISILSKALAIVVFFAMTALLIKPKALYLWVVLWLVVSPYAGGATYSKIIPLCAFIVIISLVAMRPLRPRTKLVLLGVAGFLAPLSLLDSIDVGALLCLISASLAIALVFVKQAEDGSLRIGWTGLSVRSLAPGIALTAGVATGFLLCLLVLGGAPFIEFIRLTFFEIPKYQALEWSYPLGELNGDSANVWLPVAALIMTILLVVALVRQDHRTSRWTLRPETALSVLLLAIAVVYLRFGVGRPDFGHVGMAATFIIFASFFAFQHIGPLWRAQRWTDLWPVPVLILSLIFTPTAMYPLSAFPDGPKTIGLLNEARHMREHPDDSWLSPQNIAVREFLRANTKPSDGIFIVQADPAYYYISGNTNPTRFYVSWFIDPQQWTDESLADLKRNPPKYVLFPEFSDSDGVQIADRFPEVAEWIRQHYTKQTVIDGMVVLSRE